MQRPASTPARLTRDTELDDERRQPQAHGRGTRALSIASQSYDAGARTVEAVLSAGTAVRRYYFTEELEISAAAVDLSRVAAGICPVLDSHDQGRLDAAIGRITAVRIEGGRLIGTMHFADTPAGRAIEARVAAGELRAVSIGYRVTRWQITATDENEHETWRAVAWELLEASLVSVPADPAAIVRSHSSADAGASNRNDDMRRNMPAGTATNTAADRRAVTAEEIREVCGRSNDYSDAFRAQMLADHEDEPLTRREFQTRCANQLIAARQRPSIDARQVSRGADDGSPGQMVERVADALLARLSNTAPTEGAREFMGASMIDLARGMMEARGERVRWDSPSRIVQRMSGAHTTSDFPVAMGNALNRHLLRFVSLHASPLRTLARQRTAPDFRKLMIAKFGQNPALLLVPEMGEFQRGPIVEAKEGYQLNTYGRIFGLSRQAIVNDDLGAFRDVFDGWARSALALEADLLAALISAGPVMDDGLPLYHASRGNLADTASAITVASVSTGRRAMRAQKDVGGTAILDIVPKYLVVGSDRETEAEAFLAQLSAGTVGDVNPFSGRLELIVDGRMTGKGWRLFADPNVAPVIEEARLAGQEEVHVESRVGFDVDGVESKARVDLGAGLIDYRGSYLNTGN